ncbi:MAG TPA: GNAT family N-acetyltransferase [Candidatus Angelobacter sp.]|jgi:mycothiol synthase|nr:GNAT family N-acetyltransferase [Candidatus Angelobacter sp.]
MNEIRGRPGRPPYPFTEQSYAHQLEMIRTSSMGFVDVPQVPEGYVLRQLRSGDEVPYDDLFHLAFVDDGRFAETVGRALDGGFFVVEHLASQELVASCVAMRGSSSPRHVEAGQLGWLVTDPSHTRKGLGRIVSASVTNRLMAEGYQSPFLGTEDFRIPAIAIYLMLGWRPYIYRDDMESRWRSIFANLGREFTFS